MSKTKILFIATGFLLICIVLWISYDRKMISQAYVEIASLIGCIVSLFAWIITLYQLSDIRRSAKITQDTIEKTQKSFNHLLAISDVSIAVGYSREVISFVRDEKFELAGLKMHDVKKVFWSLERIKSKLPKDAMFIKSKTSVDILMGNLNDYQTNAINTVKFNREMDTLISFLLTVDNALKNITND